ncbi:MAG: hypothetical protein DDT28_00704 [Dehalococcoidia bacterium]|nr:hypothetical protein [Chloroflexota bacterium]
MLTLPSVASLVQLRAPIDSATGLITSMALFRSLFATVKVRSVMRLILAFWTMVSTLIFALANASKIALAIPGLSGTPITVTLAILKSWAMPLTLFLISIGTPPRIRVPGLSLNEDATMIGIP